MTTKAKTIRHLIDGGWATDFGPTADVQIEADQVKIPYLLNAENVFYTLDGGVQKVGGTSKVNSAQVTSGATVRGVYDYWKQGTGGTPARRRILHSDTVCMSDNNDGVFSNIFTGLEADAIPSYTTFDDLLIISSSSNSDVPKSYDQSIAQDLAGTPPNFAFSVVHHGRLWTAGDAANPSTVGYTAAFDPEDHIGAGSGAIQVNPNDGDAVVGLASHKNDLWVFKGPNKGSIHRITGSTPSTFGLIPFVDGLGGAYHNSIFKYGDDLGFVAHDGTVHSLNATSAYGDFNEASLSRPIHKWLTEHLNFNRLKNIWAVNDPLNGRVLFTMSIDANQTNNAVLSMDYRFNPIRWSYVPAYDAESMAIFNDTNGIDRILLGSTDGYVRRSNVVNKSLDLVTAIAAKATTPHLNYGNPMLMKTISQASVAISPKGNYNGTFGWTRDNQTAQTQTFSQEGGDVLGAAASNEFTLGTSTLGGNRFVDKFMELEEGGDFRSISYEITNSGVNEDLEVHAISATISVDAVSTEN